jgi:predicted MFS family arabinose efflux permease
MKKYINILCVLILALMLADIIVDLFFTQSGSVSMKSPDDFSLGSVLLLLLLCLVMLGGVFMAFVYFIRFILNVNRNQVFTAKNVSLLRKYGVCALIVGVSFIIFSATIITGNSLVDALLDGIDTLGEGFFALLMGEIFSIGLKLEEEKKAAV